MKKLMMVLALAGALLADGAIVGAEAFYGKVGEELTATGPGGTASATGDTKTLGGTLKAGYQFGDVRLLGTLTSEKYKDDMVVVNEGPLTSIGIEADYLIDQFLVGLNIAKGSRDFDGTNIGFSDIGVRAGAVVSQEDGINLEAGVYYKNRSYDSYYIDPVTLDLDDKVLGIYIGLSFNL